MSDITAPEISGLNRAILKAQVQSLGSALNGTGPSPRNLDKSDFPADTAPPELSGRDRALLETRVKAFNTALEGSRPAQRNLDKDDFLKILITQLQNQDPTKPMEDREFIAQMAQFSSLEQMNNMSRQFTELSSALKGSGAMNLIGRDVRITRGDTLVTGTVEAVTRGPYPQVLVNGSYFDYDDITEVAQPRAAQNEED